MELVEPPLTFTPEAVELVEPPLTFTPEAVELVEPPLTFTPKAVELLEPGTWPVSGEGPRPDTATGAQATTKVHSKINEIPMTLAGNLVADPEDATTPTPRNLLALSFRACP